MRFGLSLLPAWKSFNVFFLFLAGVMHLIIDVDLSKHGNVANTGTSIITRCASRELQADEAVAAVVVVI